jgi:type I restriction enzyme S subunit
MPLGSPGTVGCMRTKNVQAELDLDDVWAVPEGLVPRDEQLLRGGDVLISSANSWNLVGKCSWVPELPYASSFGGFVAVLRPTSDKLESRFLYRWFSSTRMQALVRSFGRQTTNIANLDIQRCRDLEVPLPSLPEQRRIAAILDQADALRAKRREALAQLDSLTHSIFIEMFGDPAANALGWPMSTLRTLGRVITGGTPPGGREGMFDGPIPFLTPGDLESGAKPKRSVTDAGAAAAVTVRAGATLVCCIGATIGKTDIARVRSAFNQQLNAVDWRPSVNDVYGLFAMRSLKAVIVARGASTTLPILKKSAFEELAIAVPPLALQQTFAARIQAVEALEATHRAALAESDALFASLQHRAFAGQLS